MSDTINKTERDAHIAGRAMALVHEFGPDIADLQCAIRRARCIAAAEALSTDYAMIKKIVAHTEWQYGDEGKSYPSATFEFEIAGVLIALDGSGEVSDELLDDEEAQKLIEALPASASEQETDDEEDLYLRVGQRLAAAFQLAKRIYWENGNQDEGDLQIYPDLEESDEA